MNSLIKRWVHLIGMMILGLVFCLSFYYLVINLFHSKAIDKTVYVSESDTYYSSYKNNVENIKNNINNYAYNKKIHKYDINTMGKISNSLNYCYKILNSQETILGNTEGKLLTYPDVYNLNNYFINELIDKCFISNLTWINNNKDSWIKERFVESKFSLDIIVNNALYIKDELKDNSSYYYSINIPDTMIRNNLYSSYQLILHNYSDFSQLILEFSDYLVKGE